MRKDGGLDYTRGHGISRNEAQKARKQAILRLLRLLAAISLCSFETPSYGQLRSVTVGDTPQWVASSAQN